jgi:DUF971 family protein
MTAFRHDGVVICVFPGNRRGWLWLMRPADLQVIGTDLAIRWEDGSESFIPLATLRRACPCASCAGEKDILGNVSKGPERPLTSQSTQVVRLVPVGGYAVQPVWGDGHNTGLYSYEQLRRIASAG